MTKKKNKKLINVLQFAGFGFPALFIWMSVVIIPFIYGIWITFTDWNGLAMHINYVGLQNYIDVFKDATFVSSFVKTVIYAFFTVLASNIVGFALALAVTSGIKVRDCSVPVSSPRISLVELYLDIFGTLYSLMY